MLEVGFIITDKLEFEFKHHNINIIKVVCVLL